MPCEAFPSRCFYELFGNLVSRLIEQFYTVMQPDVQINVLLVPRIFSPCQLSLGAYRLIVICLISKKSVGISMHYGH